MFLTEKVTVHRKGSGWVLTCHFVGASLLGKRVVREMEEARAGGPDGWMAW